MISIRLQSLAKHINYNDKIIDIGCDHALLDIYLVKNNIVKKMIISDVNQKALNNGIENIKKNNLEEKIEARLGYGLDVLTEKDKVNTVLISGMGTSTITKILNDNHLVNVEKLIIQSNNDHAELRHTIVDLGFKIKAEDFLVDNNKHYINIVFVRGKEKYNKNELRYGPILIHNKNYLQFELNNCQKIYNLIPKSKFKLRFLLGREMKTIGKLLK